MSILGALIKKAIQIGGSFDRGYPSPFDSQKKELKKLLTICKNTEFGKNYDFKEILKEFESTDKYSFYNKFKENVPIHDYDEMYNNWWHRAQKGESNICWPGKIKYFALSAGSSGPSAKYIPVTREMIKAIQKARLHILLSISKYNLPDKLFESKTLGIGGSTQLNFKGICLFGLNLFISPRNQL